MQATSEKVKLFCEERNYTLLTSLSEIKNYTSNFTYICKCKTKRERNFGNIKSNKKELSDINYIPSCCINNNSISDKLPWYLTIEASSYYDKNLDETWKHFQQYWVSNKGKVIGKRGEDLVKDGIIKTSRKSYRLEELLSLVFFPTINQLEKIPFFKDNESTSFDNIFFCYSMLLFF